jgi:Fe-S-cluster containining protein
MSLPNNEAAGVCAACGGQCCRGFPGIDGPERFLASADPVRALADALASGDWVLLRHIGVPWVNGVEPCEDDKRRVLHYPRPATVDERARGEGAADGLSSSPCVFLGDAGCTLAFEARPRMCQSLEPSSDGECPCPWDRRAAALAWLPWQELVSAALTRLGR